MSKLVRVLAPLVVVLAVGCGKQEETVVPASAAKPVDAAAPAAPPPAPPADAPPAGTDNPTM